MNSDDVFNIIEIIGGETGKHSKTAMLADFLEVPLFATVARLAYDPLTTFGILKVSPDTSGLNTFGDRTFDILGELARRELTGNFAEETVHAHIKTLSPSSAELFVRILNKNLKAGFGVKSLNLAAPGFLEVAKYMRMSLFKADSLKSVDWSGGMIVQEKLDMMFANVTRSGNRLIVSTRASQVFPDIVSDLLFGLDFQEGFHYHGELLVKSPAATLRRSEGNGVLNSLLKGGSLPKNLALDFSPWDMVADSAVEGVLASEPYKCRLSRLHMGSFRGYPVKSRTIHSEEEAWDFYREVRAGGGEGAILKSPDNIWKNGTALDMWKLKAEILLDLRVIGYTPGTGRNSATFGSLICVSEDGLLSTDVAGFSDVERARIMLEWDTFEGSIITVKAQETTQSKKDTGYSLTHPRYEGERPDKEEADTLERILEIEQNSKGGPRGA